MFETRPSSRRLYLFAGVILLTAAVIDTVIWSIACQRLAASARDAAFSSGWTLSAGGGRWSGWPDAAEITLPDPVLRAGPDVIPPLVWTAEHAVLRLSAWHPTILTATVTGAQTLAIGVAPPVPFTAQRLVVTIDLTAHDPVRIAIAALDVATPDGPVRVASTDLLMLPDALSATLSGMSLPGHAGQPIEPPIETLRIDGRMTSPIDPQPTAAESARRWRASGGKLDLSAVSLRWGPLDAAAHAILTLDENLQPALTGQLTVTGLAPVIERFAQTGAMTRSAATAAQAMFTILAAPTGGGPVTLPVTLQAGIVSIARIPLLRLAPLRWD